MVHNRSGSYDEENRWLSMRSDEEHRWQGRFQKIFRPPIETKTVYEDVSTAKNSRRQSPYLRQEFPERMARIAEEELVYPVRNNDEEHIYVVNLAQVQRLNLHTLQKELAEEVGRILRTKRMGVTQGRTIRRLMSEYCGALRDWDLMEEKHAMDVEKDPFKLTTAGALHKKLMEEARILDNLPQKWIDKMEHSELQKPSDSSFPKLPGDSRARLIRERELQAVLKRFGMGLLGAVALLAPMILMVLHKDTLTTLLTVSAATLIFAFLVAVYSHKRPLELFSITAAYSAVLVVFVGTSS